jgi:hypothetical protein
VVLLSVLARFHDTVYCPDMQPLCVCCECMQHCCRSTSASADIQQVTCLQCCCSRCLLLVLTHWLQMMHTR